MADLTIKKGTTETWAGTVSHTGSDPPLQDATELKLYMREADAATNKIDGADADSFDAAGNWEYTPDAADVDAPGTYRLYLRATYPGPVTKRFPENQQRYYAEIVIQESFE